MGPILVWKSWPLTFVALCLKELSEAAGFVRGVPSTRPPDPIDGAYAIDRLIRSMTGEPWVALILAEPMKESAIRRLGAPALKCAVRIAQRKPPLPLRSLSTITAS